MSSDLNATAASLLGFLHHGPQSGYELAQSIDGSIGNFWNVTRSQIYRELKTLAEAGYVRVGATGARERQPYTLTATGRRAFASFMAKDPPPEITRFPLLLAIFFGDRLPPEEFARIVRINRARHEARLAEYRRRLPQMEREHPYPAMTMRFGLMYEEMCLRWFDTLPTAAS